jgi:hypothetical protein
MTVLESQLGDAGMIKDMASSFLSSRTTVMEYDLKQVGSMQSGMLFSTLLMWFLHFKMNQVQPLFIQTIMGVSEIFYSPLFQIYILRRNLERPFKTPLADKLQQSVDATTEAVDEEVDVPTDDVDKEDAILNSNDVEVKEKEVKLTATSIDSDDSTDVESEIKADVKAKDEATTAEELTTVADDKGDEVDVSDDSDSDDSDEE